MDTGRDYYGIVVRLRRLGYYHLGCSTHTTGECHQGYIDSFRITKGVCRYTANFDPMDDYVTYLNYASTVQ